MIQINLLPDLKREFLHAQKVRNKVITGSILLVIGVIAILVLLAIYTFGVQSVHASILDGQIDERSKALKEEKDLGKYLTIQNQLSELPALHSSKGSYSRLFDYLQQLNPAEPDDVRISKMSLNATEKTLLIEGFAQNYRSLNVFEKTLQNAKLTFKTGDDQVEEQLFTEVTMTQVGVGREGSTGNQLASFTALLTYSENAFSYDIQAPSVRVPNLIITNSVRGTPQTFEVNPEAN